jgi:rod shape-determining protein MreC
MKTLISVILRFHVFLLFILLEILSLSFVISSDIEKKNVFFSSANAISGFFNKNINNLSSYFWLKSENKQLVNENLRLRKELAQIKLFQNLPTHPKVDTSSTYRYEYYPARVIKNTVSRNHNYITIDKGRRDGIEKDFGVISSEGVVGIVVATSERYSLVISILNTNLGISGKIKKNNYYGTVQWEGGNYRYIDMYEIPNHLMISIGDTIVTSGYSAIFPEGVGIGTISKIDKNTSNNFFDLQLELLSDFKNLYSVYVINNKNRWEQIQLEKTVEDEY